jgi:CubicO group peptidase (beta-lactamase class C family)
MYIKFLSVDAKGAACVPSLMGFCVVKLMKAKHILFIFVSAFSLNGANAAVDLDKGIVKEISTTLDEAAKKENFSGTFLLAKQDQILFQKAYGLAYRPFNVPNDLDTKFSMASMSKLFTSVAIAQLVERKKLSLTDPISLYLKGWLDKKIAKQITVQDLLIHSSGLGSFFDDKDFQEKGGSGLYIAVKDYQPLVLKEKPRFKPGTSQLYSSTGYLLLGAIIEKVSGQTYFDYVQEHIFTPAGMTNSGFFQMDDSVSNLAIGFGREKIDGKISWKNNLFSNVLKGSPAGGGFSTVGDMFRFMQAITTYKLVSKATARELLSGEIVRPPNAKYHKEKIVVQGQTYEVVFSEYGPSGLWNRYGLEIFSSRPLSIGHSGGGMRGINDDLIIYPTEGYLIIYFSNYTGEGILDPRNKIEELLKNSSLR